MDIEINVLQQDTKKNPAFRRFRRVRT